MIHLDTTFLVDLQREAVKGSGPATAFLHAHGATPLCVSVHVLCELEAGARLARHPERERARLLTLTGGLAVASPDRGFADVYARTYVALERQGRRIPVMDLLIAVAALIDNAPLVTRNTKDFSNVPDLDVLAY